MIDTRPLPFKRNCLERLQKTMSLSCIVDVGVQKATPELIDVFPDKKHYLFEPVTFFHEEIKSNYANLNYHLYPIALSDIQESMYVVTSSLNANGVPTHGHIIDKPVDIDGNKIINCTTVEVNRFDQLDLDIEKDFLLKVDVDGKDLEVLKGFGELLGSAAVIIVEATFRSIASRMACCLASGFQLMDIVDIVYYGQSIYQCDLVFIRDDLLTKDIRPSMQNFKREQWAPFKNL